MLNYRDRSWVPVRAGAFHDEHVVLSHIMAEGEWQWPNETSRLDPIRENGIRRERDRRAIVLHDHRGRSILCTQRNAVRAKCSRHRFVSIAVVREAVPEHSHKSSIRFGAEDVEAP